MRTPRRGLLVLAAIAGVAMTLLSPTAAHAAYYGSETDYAAYSLGPSGAPAAEFECHSFTGITVCFKRHGERFYVKDTRADGYAAVAEWTFDYEGTRSGACVNKLNAGDWGVCNKSFAENKPLYIRAALYDRGNLVVRDDYRFIVST